MSIRMLIDARHSEETRVTIVKGSRVENFDFESSTKLQLKGNIYLARITRVEPSLQAAFVEYGGNRHGFLAFSEIHPDYYQIPAADRDAIVAAELQAVADVQKKDLDAGEGEKKRRGRRRRGRKPVAETVTDVDASVSEDAAEGNEIDTSADETNGDTPVVDGSDAASAPEAATAADDAEATEAETPDDQDESAVSDDTSETGEVSNGAYDQSNDGDSDHEELDTQESDDEDKEAEIEAAAAARRRSLKALKHKYSIQEVIKRRQVLLIQVVKEERGNKGAALTTYMSLAGRYCVLMPNSTHSGGISRKIS
ncbi:MAG: S1 RNA-binding domain-containing protein, partial [Kordiimonadaceae bacterium]|nr:S1 RNA-binding domain-containing protein [Kordiimonadaceae bacterium]